GTLANINSFIAASNVTFTTATNATADVTLTITVNDNGNTGSGGSQEASETVTLTVTVVNDAPTDIALSSASVNQSAGVNADVGTFSTTDPDTDDTHTYALVAG